MIPQKSLFVIYALGIFVCYFLYGILQEKIMLGHYGQQLNDDGTVGERFTFALALVWVQCLCNFIFAKGLLTVRAQPKDTTHTGHYAVCALTYLLAMVSGNMALRWVSYSAQVVGKSAQPIPVMILGALIGRKSYSWIRYACVVIIVVGVILFMYKENTDSTYQVPSDKMRLGELLLLLSLTMDGMLAAVQERMRSSSNPSGQQMMVSMNLWSTLMLGIVIIATGEANEFVQFAIRHPEVWLYVDMLALCGCLGQFFIFLMIARFGTLACSVVTTTRRFFIAILFFILFDNALMPLQWFGAVLMFSGIFVDIFYSKRLSATDKVYRPNELANSDVSVAFNENDEIINTNLVPHVEVPFNENIPANDQQNAN